MGLVKVRVLSATVDGQGPNSLISIDERSAFALAEVGYVEVIAEDKQNVVVEKAKGDDAKAVVEKESAPTTTNKPRKAAPTRNRTNTTKK